MPGIPEVTRGFVVAAPASGSGQDDHHSRVAAASPRRRGAGRFAQGGTGFHRPRLSRRRERPALLQSGSLGDAGFHLRRRNRRRFARCGAGHCRGRHGSLRRGDGARRLDRGCRGGHRLAGAARRGRGRDGGLRRSGGSRLRRFSVRHRNCGSRLQSSGQRPARRAAPGGKREHGRAGSRSLAPRPRAVAAGSASRTGGRLPSTPTSRAS